MTEVVRTLVESPKVDVNVNKKEANHSFSSGESSQYEMIPLWIAVLRKNAEIL